MRGVLVLEGLDREVEVSSKTIVQYRMVRSIDEQKATGTNCLSFSSCVCRASLRVTNVARVSGIPGNEDRLAVARRRST
jgi:hypothetical protein